MYLQTRHYVCTDLSVKDSGLCKNVVCDTLSMLSNRPYKIKFLYTPLLAPMKDRLWRGSLLKWSQDIPEIDSSEVWLQHCESILRWLPSAAMQETHLKFIQRAYISPAQRKHMVADETGCCKKCGVVDASYFHCFWECGKIRKFWNKLVNFLNSTFSLRLAKLPIPCLMLQFSEWDFGPRRNQIRPIVAVILTIAKQCILFHWIKSTPPFLHELRSRLLNVLFYDKQRAFPDVDRGSRWYDRKWGAYIEKLPPQTQRQLLSGFENTTWYLTKQISN